MKLSDQRRQGATIRRVGTESLRMQQDESKSPLAVLSAVPWNNLLLGFITLDCANRLTTGLPGLFGPNPNFLGTALDVVFVGYGVNELLKQAGVGKTDYYADLEGAEVASFAREAGEFALRGDVPTRSGDGRYEVATFAGGCFWGTVRAPLAGTHPATPAPATDGPPASPVARQELHFQRMPGVVATCVGYTQGAVERPSYAQVCSGTTGHTEGLQLTFDPSIVTYEALCDKLLAVLGPDATALNRVGNDRGTQYRHGIYPHTDAQAEAAARAIARCQAGLAAEVVTEVKPAKVFWPAEGYHQRYLQKGGQSAEKACEVPVRCYG